MNKKIIQQLIQKDNPIILEIGAHKGTDTIEFLRIFPEVRIYSFEPDPRNAQYHRNFISDPRSKLYEVAISDEDGQAIFYQSGEEINGESQHDGSSSLKKPKEHLLAYPQVQFKSSTSVKTVRLDTWYRENNLGEIDFVWADVQGAEEQLIKGGLETLSNTRYFYTEYSDRELYENQINFKSIKALLPEFEFICFYGGNVLLKNTRYTQSPMEIYWERAYFNYYIYTYHRREFRMPFKTGVRKLYYRLTGQK